MTAVAKSAIVAALEREVRPLAKGWAVRHQEHDGRSFKFFESDGVVLVCGGIGAEAARRAAEAAVAIYRPELLISAGFAGALNTTLEVGHTFTPQQVVDAGDGSRIESAFGEGVLVSFADVANVEQKKRLGEAYGADAVDMEAAAVARCAEAHNIKFMACKVISDTSSTKLPPITPFIGTDGRFHDLRFLGYVLLRPWLWARVMQLARNSGAAAAKLCTALADSRMRTLAVREKVTSN